MLPSLFSLLLFFTRRRRLQYELVATVQSTTDTGTGSRDCGSINIGAANADRMVCVVIHTGYAEISGFNITGVSIGGVAADGYEVQYSIGYNNLTCATIIAWRKIPSGTTANVTFTYSTSVSIRFHVVTSYRITGSPTVAKGNHAKSQASPSNVSLSASAGDVVICGGIGRSASASTTATLTGATQDNTQAHYDSLVRTITGSSEIVSTGTKTLSVTWASVSGSQQSAISVSFKP